MAAPTVAPIGALRGAVDLAPLVARQNQQAAGRPPAASSAPAGSQNGTPVIVEVGDADFDRVVELSAEVPVIVALVADWSTPATELLPVLAEAVRAQRGRMALAVVDADANPQLAAAFQAQSVPTVAAVIAGRPVSLFAGSATAEQLEPLLAQVLELAAQNGVTGSLAEEADVADPAPATPVEAPLPPHHAEAYDAIDRQDYAEAALHFRTAIAQDPRDTAAVAALAQVELLERLTRTDAGAVRAAAAADAGDVASQLAVADLELSAGQADDALGRLLDLFAVAGDERTAVRTRLLAYFEILGADDARVGPARRRLAALLY